MDRRSVDSGWVRPRRRARTGTATVLCLAFLLAWTVYLRPPVLGGSTMYTLISGDSMLPTLHEGDLGLVRSASEYRTGDIVAFPVPEGERGEGLLVIHRIVDGSASDGFRLQGDNNAWLDPWQPGPDEIVGRLWLRVPVVGRLLLSLRDPLALAGLAGGLAALVAMGGRQRRENEAWATWDESALYVCQRSRSGAVRGSES